MVRSVKEYMMQVMCTSSQLNDHLKAFIKVLFTALLILYHILPGNIVDAFPTSGCESGLFLHVNPETRTRVCCITVPLPKGFEYVSCDVNGGYDRIAKCPDGLYQVDNTTTASEAKCSSEIECNPDENLKISDCDAQGHCIFSCICNYDKGYCGPNFYDCQSFPSDCDQKWVQKDCTCKWKPTASTGSTLENTTNKPVQKIITTPSTVDGESRTTEKKGRTLIGEEDDEVLLTIKNNGTGDIKDQKQRGLQHHEIIIIVSAVVISAFIIILAVYCWKSKRNREYQSVGYSGGPSDSNNNNGGGGSSCDMDDKPDIAEITQTTVKVIGSRKRSVAVVRPQPNSTAQGLSTFSDHVHYTSEPSVADEGYMHQISFSTLTMERYSDFTWSVLDNPNVPPNEETAVLKLDNQQEQDDMRSEQQPSEETHTEELQAATNNMEYDVPEDESLYSQFSSGIYHATNT